MNNDNSSKGENINNQYNLYIKNNDDNDNEEDSESRIYFEHGAHFRYNDLYNNLLKIKKERDKEEECNRVINNNIIINNNLNLNLFNNNKHKIISRNIHMNNYLNNLHNLNLFENSNITNTFLDNISNRQMKLFNTKLIII